MMIDHWRTGSRCRLVVCIADAGCAAWRDGRHERRAHGRVKQRIHRPAGRRDLHGGLTALNAAKMLQQADIILPVRSVEPAPAVKVFARFRGIRFQQDAGFGEQPGDVLAGVDQRVEPPALFFAEPHDVHPYGNLFRGHESSPSLRRHRFRD
jgi:hypothetical protein